MPETFGELQRYLEWVERMKAEIRQALIYPATILLAVLALFILLFTFVIPRFEPILNSLNVPLPIVTELVLSFSGFMEQTWWIWVLLALIIPTWGVVLQTQRTLLRVSVGLLGFTSPRVRSITKHVVARTVYP